MQLQGVTVEFMRRARQGASRGLALGLLAAAACAHVVTVDSEPPGALVTINGQAVGKTPLQYEDRGDPAVAEHVIVVRLNGYESAELRVRRRHANPWALISVTPLCGSVAWPAALVPLIGGLILSPVTCGAGIVVGAPVAAIVAAAGCAWMLVTSPTLLMLQRAQTLPDQIAFTLKPGTSFEQHDEGLTWPPAFYVPPDDDAYWQNPAPPVEDAAQSLPAELLDDDDDPASVPASRPAGGQAF